MPTTPKLLKFISYTIPELFHTHECFKSMQMRSKDQHCACIMIDISVMKTWKEFKNLELEAKAMILRRRVNMASDSMPCTT